MFNAMRWPAWGPECLALVSAIASFIAMVVLLAHFDSQPVFTWQGVTLNTMVSILSVATKAALAYVVSECMAQWKWILFAREERPLIDFDRIDGAARGPLGSLRVLLRTKGALAVQLGSVLTLLALGLDPLAQQLVQLNETIEFTHIRNQEGQRDLAALNSRTTRYEMGTAIVTEDHIVNSSNSQYYVTTDIPLSMKAAIMNGLSKSPWEISQEALVQCPTSNCTWDQFNTLGICHRCKDLTSELKRVEGFGDALVAIDKTQYDSYEVPSTAYTLPNGHFIANIDGCPPYNGVFTACKDEQPLGIYSSKRFALTSYGTGNPNKTNSMKDIDTLLWSMSIIYPDLEALNKTDFGPGDSSGFDFNDTLPLWPDISLRATECALYYCAKTVNSAIHGNQLKETITEAVRAKKRPDSWERLSEFENGQPENKIPTIENGSLEFNRYWSAVPYSSLVLEFPDNSSESYYTIAEESVKSLSAHMQALFKANWTGGSVIGREIRKKLGKNAVGFNGASYGPYSDLTMEAKPPALDGLWTWTRHNAPRAFEALGISMTNEMRRKWQPEKGQEPETAEDRFREGILEYPGNVGRSVVLYRIEWPWIALHGAMVLLVILFLCITLWNSSSRHVVPLWKSSSLAAIRHGHDVGGVLNRTFTIGDMENAARKAYVKVPKEEFEEMVSIDRERLTPDSE